MSVPDPFYLRFLILARKVSVPFPDVRSRDFVREPSGRAVQTFLLLESSRDVLGNVYSKTRQVGKED